MIGSAHRRRKDREVLEIALRSDRTRREDTIPEIPLVFRTCTVLLRSAIFARRGGREESSRVAHNSETRSAGTPTADPKAHTFPSFSSFATHPALYGDFLYARIYNSRSFRYTIAVSILASYEIESSYDSAARHVLPSRIW